MTKKQKRGLRIIAGAWRGRRLRLPDNTTVRPTPDRVRETLFNWLGPAVEAARCLDLFAGSGALGLEALSRGAAGVCFVESDRRLAAELERHLQVLGGNGVVSVMSAGAFLEQNRERFDIAFLDPPYEVAIEPLMVTLRSALAPDAQIYIERSRAEGLPRARELGWRKQSHAAGTAFGLAVFE